jgi:hypothetical protein
MTWIQAWWEDIAYQYSVMIGQYFMQTRIFEKIILWKFLEFSLILLNYHAVSRLVILMRNSRGLHIGDLFRADVW